MLPGPPQGWKTQPGLSPSRRGPNRVPGVSDRSLQRGARHQSERRGARRRRLGPLGA